MSHAAFRALCAVSAVALLLMGLAFFGQFFAYQQPGSAPPIPTGPVGHYFVGFTGTALLGWAGGLVAAARDPRAGGAVAAFSALALVLMAVQRMLAWLVGDYAVWLGALPRVEAAVFLLFALAFVWLKPRAAPRGAAAAEGA